MIPTTQIILTFLPFSTTYGITSLILLSLSSFSLAKNLYSRVTDEEPSLMIINLWIKGIIVLFGLCIFPLTILFKSSPLYELVSFIGGIPLGFLYVESEKYIIRYFSRRKLAKSTICQKENRSNNLSIQPQTLGLSSTQKKSTNLRIDRKTKAINTTSISNSSLLTLVLLAIFEEIIYRGYLTLSICFIPIFFLKGLAFISVAILFAFIHSSYSLPQILAKFLLSLLTLMTFLVLGTITTAIVIHIYLNIAAHNYAKTTSILNKKHIPT
jgi:hypothetical protein